MRVVLTCWGASAGGLLAVEFTRAGAWDSVGPEWTLTFLATYLAGLWAIRSEPGNRAAVRLLVFGCVALTFVAASLELVIQVQAGLVGIGFVSGNAVVQMISFGFVVAQVAALVRYPNGLPRLAVERWSVGALSIIAASLPILLLITRPYVVPAWIVQFSGESDGLGVPMVTSPLYVPALDGLGVGAQLLNDWLLVIGPMIAVGIAAARYRVLDDTDRRRMAWPLLAALVLVLGVVVHGFAEAGALPSLAGETINIASHILLPVSLGIGIAAPHIFDALGTARRTLWFAVLALLILGAYVAAAGLLGVTVGGRNLWLAVLVALLAALVLEPARRTLIRRAGGLAFGRELSRDDLLLRVGETLERTMDRQALTQSIAELALEGLGREWVWLEPAGTEPVHVGRPRRPHEEPVLISRLRHGQGDLGLIACGPATGGRVDPSSRMKLDTLARQIALALTNARLANELNAQLIEVDASRQRLLEAEQTARRRFERDLHDGAQQDLAALLTRIALARSQLGRLDVDRLDQTLATLQADAADALQNLRELVSGIHETTLADQGLAAAIEGRAARLPIPVQVTYSPGMRRERLAPTVESTAYFTVCEALANTLKHGKAGRASVALALDDGHLRIDVADDGQGFDPTDVAASTGLTGLRDRLAAIGGTLDVRAAPGSGTTLTAIVPAHR
jgi:signal transduction histidine kinase